MRVIFINSDLRSINQYDIPDLSQERLKRVLNCNAFGFFNIKNYDTAFPHVVVVDGGLYEHESRPTKFFNSDLIHYPAAGNGVIVGVDDNKFTPCELSLELIRKKFTFPDLRIEEWTAGLPKLVYVH